MTERAIPGAGLFKILLLLLLLGILAVQAAGIIRSNLLPIDDFVEYWAASRLLVAGDNPYSPQALLILQRSIGWVEPDPLMMWNPPWTLSFLLPFALFDYPVSRLLWLLLHFALILFCSDWLWRFYGGPAQRRWLAWLLGLAFFPSLFTLRLGQIAPLLLAGVVAFLYFERRGNWLLMGASMVLLAIKLHLLYLVWIALLLWLVDHRRWQVAVGVAGGLLLALALPMLVNPAVLRYYLETTTQSSPLHHSTLTLGALLRHLFGVEQSWLQFLPSVLGAIWFLVYWPGVRARWQWKEKMPLLLLVAALSSAYGWAFDLVVLLPPVLAVAARLYREGSEQAIRLAALFYFTFNGVALAMNLLHVHVFWYLWMVPLLLVAYLVARRPTAPEQRRLEGAIH